ncbi:MAG: hypothetical protein VXV79_02240 [Pseudomonadota bacterium]|nr:hypothetical protein [Pseudomonadota bacterium]
MKKYRWKCRVLLVKTPDYKNLKYKKAKKLYQNNIKQFHKRVVKLISKKTSNNFSIELFGFDGTKKQTFQNFDSRKIFKIIDKMPISKVLKNKKIKLLNLSLFSDYNPKTTTYGLGFKNKEKALYTIKAIKKRNLKYQVNVIATMLGRAKKHPYKNKNMRDAIKVFSSWMENYKKNRMTKF